MSIESPRYTIIQRDNKFEIRDYEEYIVAEVDVEADYSDALNTGFRMLAGHIFGSNSARTIIAITSYNVCNFYLIYLAHNQII